MALPESYLTTYKSYKTGTSKIVTWLVENARRCGADLSFLPATAGASKGNEPKKGVPSKYPVPIREFTSLANTIVSTTSPRIRIPKHITTLIKGVIGLRKYAAKLFAQFSKNKTDPAILADRAGHAHFVTVLEDVLEILQPTTSNTASQDDDLDNVFAALSVEEVTSEGTTRAKSAKKVNGPQYEMEEEEDGDDFFVFVTFMNDMNDIRSRLMRVWADYRCGKLDLMSAAITTDTAFNMMKRNSSELLESYPEGLNYEDMLTFLLECMLELGEANDGFADWTCAHTFTMLEDYASILPTNKLPALKPGHYGVYDPKKDRAKMSTRERETEDLIIIMDILPEFTKIASIGCDIPAEDELTAGMRKMMNARSIEALPLYAVFAMQVFLDIHHVLREDVIRPFEQMQATGKRLVATIDDYFRFSRGRHIETWPPYNDDLLRRLRALAIHYTQKDVYGTLFTSIYEDMGAALRPFFFLKNHPVLCGLWTYHMNTQLQELGITLCNAWGSVIYPAHFYNAARQSASLESDWKDMDYIIALHSPQRLFVGAPPTQPREYLKRFMLALGVSATNFARNRRTGGRSLIVESKKGPRGLKTTTPVKDIFHNRYGLGETAKLSTANLIAMLSVASKAERTNQPSVDLQALSQDLATQKQYSPLQILDIVREGVAGEELHLIFDYFGLHQRCWKMLRTVQTHLHADLVKHFGEMYMEEEAQLPFVIGNLFEVVWGSDRIMEALRVEGGSRMLHTAAGVLDRFLQDEENSAKSNNAAKASSNAVLMGASIGASDN
ncbi:hypothetical protein PRZ48_007784 [Zasmidium cellare]|uniref:DUF6604 domain-containing protein n=1 Tax=Zasmidium cellare TaxID=395010 RepID=A0ABR0EKP5_ZASCE|nr:hypothetical protein PRZ48_007784 [Zasmidium cellare]